MKKMNSFLASLLTVTTLVGLSFTVVPEMAVFKVNTAESSVQWKAYKVTGEHSGVVNLQSGDLSFDDDGNLAGGTFVMDMTSIKVTDLEGEWAGKLEGHLKSPDFFGVEKHPTATLVITKVVPKGTPGDYKVTGNLTIKEKTKEVRFYAHVDSEGGKMNATADLKIDRTDFDVRYGSGSFFDGLGDKTIYDEFDLTVNIVASK
ncbi:MAG: YceI family protein [Saprospiraceae bacterium]